MVYFVMDLNCTEINTRIKKIRGQLEGVEKMIAQQRDSVDIVTQISAIRSALSSLASEILKIESSNCFKQKSKKEKIESFNELVESFFKIN